MNEDQINEIMEKDNRLSFTDKLSGIFLSPSETFQKIKQTSPHFSDWLYAILVFVFVGAAVNFLVMSDPVLSSQIEEKQMEKIEKNFQELVEQGHMTQEQVDEQLDKIRDNIEQQMSSGRYIQSLSLLVVTLIFFFVISGFFYLIIKFALKGNGQYAHAMTAYGLPYYIWALQNIVLMLYMFLTKNFVDNLSLASLMHYDTSTYLGILLNKIDIFSIWFYYLVSLGFAKLFEIDFKKTAITIFGIWILSSLFFHFLGETFTFLKFFGF